MAIHVYDCPDGHQFEVIEPASKVSRPKCPHELYAEPDTQDGFLGVCGKRAKLGVGRTGAPILRRGIGGFHKPSLDPMPPSFNGDGFTV